jgi:hypothetical protein
MLKNRFRNLQGRRFAVLGALVLAGACGNTKTTFTDTNMGGGGGNGGQSGWTYLPPGNGTAGSNSTNGGVASGGSPAHAGMAGTAGVGGAVVLPPVTYKCGGQKPSQAVITSFDGFMADAWTSPGNVAGGIYVYPDTFQATAGDFLGFEDEVSNYTGIGLFFNGCLDASKYTGVRFTISGDAGSSGTVRFFPVVNRNRDVSDEFSVGSCVPDDPSNPWPSCHPPEVSLPVTSQPTVHSVPWSAFTGGVPTATTNGSDLLTFEWAFRWQAGDATYTGKLTIDDVAFYKDENQGGAGGAGGAGDEAGAPGTSGTSGTPVGGQPGQ